MQATSPDWHAELALNDENLALSFCASLPFCNVKDARFSTMGPAATSTAREEEMMAKLEKRMMSREEWKRKECRENSKEATEREFVRVRGDRAPEASWWAARTICTKTPQGLSGTDDLRPYGSQTLDLPEGGGIMMGSTMPGYLVLVARQSRCISDDGQPHPGHLDLHT